MAGYSARLEFANLAGAKTAAVRLSAPDMDAAIVPAAGGELSSWRVNWQGAPVETIYRALDYRPTKLLWTGRAPLLWPQPGRCSAENATPGKADWGEGSWRLDHHILPMPGHGFVRAQPWRLLEHSADESSAWTVVSFRGNEQTRRFYPFDVELICLYRLTAGALTLEYKIRNLEKSRECWFGVGNHITFNMPLTSAGSFVDCRVSSPTNKELEIGPDAFLTGRSAAKDLRGGRALADESLCNAMFGGYKADAAWVEITDPAAFGVRVAQRAHAPGGPRADTLRFVFWAEPELRYFCPEPWVGEPNTLNTRRAAVVLPPGEEMRWTLEFQPLIPQEPADEQHGG